MRQYDRTFKLSAVIASPKSDRRSRFHSSIIDSPMIRSEKNKEEPVVTDKRKRKSEVKAHPLWIIGENILLDKKCGLDGGFYCSWGLRAWHWVSSGRRGTRQSRAAWRRAHRRWSRCLSSCPTWTRCSPLSGRPEPGCCWASWRPPGKVSSHPSSSSTSHFVTLAATTPGGPKHSRTPSLMGCTSSSGHLANTV